MYIFNSPLEQFEVSSYTTYHLSWTAFWSDIYQNNFFFNSGYMTHESLAVNFSLYLTIFIIIKLLSSVIKIRNIFFMFFTQLAFLWCISFVVFVDYKYTVLDFSLSNNELIETINYATAMSHWIDIFFGFFTLASAFFIIYILNYGLTDIENLTIVPSFNHTISEMIYKTALDLFVSSLGKDGIAQEFFLKIKTVFIFLLVVNLQGMIPYTATVTSALSNTFYMALALFISIIYTIFQKQGINYFLNLFMPPGCPMLLSFLLIPIEVISYSFRVISLSVRLFANMMAGHTLLKVIVGFSWIMVFFGDGMLICNLIPIAVLFILILLEIGVALIQAYIFTTLSCIYIKDIFEGH